MPPKSYFPGKNYWQIAGQSNVYYSGTNVLVPTTDADYQTWVNAGNSPTPIPSEIELWGVLQAAVPSQFPAYLFNGTTFIQPAPNNLTAAQIKSYSADVRWKKETGGIVFRGHPIITTREAQSQIDTALAQATRNSAWVADWKCADATFWPIDVAICTAMAAACETFVNKCFGVEQDTVTNAAITTTTQVDNAFAFSNVYS